ncbi:MAG: ATP-binding protein [Bacteriovorax sp.]|jgi:C4-dicarboxylate-specific signal transduction histidine kinase
MKKLSTLTAFSTFAATLIGVGLVAISTYTLIERLVDRHLENEQEHALVIAKQAIVLPLWNYDEVYIQEILNSFLDEKLDTVIAAKIVSEDKLHAYSATSKNYQNQNLDELVKQNRLNQLSSQIVYRGHNLGQIKVYYSTAQFSTAFRNLGGVIFVITIVMGIIFASIMTYLLRKWITSPLYEISRDAGKVELGDYKIKFKTDYVGELNVVTESFNQTINAIQERDKKLIEHNLQLENLVEKRTKERDQEQLKSFQASRLAALGEMAGAIAHEINNPLTIIQGHSTLLKLALQKNNSSELVQKAEKIHDTSERIAKIIKGLKSFSRDGTFDPPAESSVESFIEDLTFLCLNRANEKQIKINFNYTPGDLIYGNMTQLGQVLINLINNSIDAVENLDEKWIVVKSERSNNRTRITVTDSGLGIDESILDKIMNPFFTTKELGKGTGLGLSISHGIVTNHEGEFFYNTHSKNTQFVILLPNAPETMLQLH